MRHLPKHTAKCRCNLVFFCSPLTHHYKLSGQPWFSRSQGSFLTKLTSSEAKMSLMTQQLLIPSPAALDIKMELVKSFLIGSSQVGIPLQRRWRRVNFQGMCPQMKKRNVKPENRGHAGPALTSRLLKTSQGQTVSAWSQANPSIGLLFYRSKYVQETDGFWIRISPKHPHVV